MLILLIGSVAFAVFVFLLWRTRRKIAAIRSAPSSKIGDLEDGYWKVSGRISALDEPLVSPLSRTACVFYLFKVEELRTRRVRNTVGGGGRHHSHTPGHDTVEYWETVINDRQAVCCEISDDTGAAEVDLLAAETVLSPSGHSTSGTFNSCPDSLQRTLAKRYGFSTKGLLFNKPLRYTETVIEDGDRLFVVGNVEIDPRGDAAFVRGSQPFIVSDRNQAKLLRHYRSRATWYTVGAIASIVVAPILALPLADFFKGHNPGKPVAGANDQPPGAINPFRGGQPKVDADAGKTGAPPDPTPIDEITRGLTELRSPDPGLRTHGAILLDHTPFDASRRDEVLAALLPVTKDENVTARTFALQAYRKWEKGPVPEPKTPDTVVTGPGRKPITEPIQEDGYYRQPPRELPPVAIPWTAEPDPAPTTEAPAKAWNAIPIHDEHIIIPGIASPFVAVTPKPARGQLPPPQGLTQVYDLRSGKPFGKPVLTKWSLGDHRALSPDGKYLAAWVPAIPETAVVEVTDTSSGAARLITAGQGHDYAFPIEFVAPDRLLTVTHDGKFIKYGTKCVYKVWDVKSGELKAEFAFLQAYSPKSCGISGGGRYFVYQQVRGSLGSRLVAFDTTTGKVVGDVIFQPTKDPFGQSVGIAFSPDGTKFAVLWRLGKKPDRWGQVLVFDAATGERLATHNLGYVIKDIDSLWYDLGGPDCIQWTPDGSAVLLFGHLVVNGQSGEVTSRLGPEPHGKNDVQHRRFVGPEYATTTFRRGLDVGLTLIPLK
jgi:hypothetical protein